MTDFLSTMWGAALVVAMLPSLAHVAQVEASQSVKHMVMLAPPSTLVVDPLVMEALVTVVAEVVLELLVLAMARNFSAATLMVQLDLVLHLAAEPTVGAWRRFLDVAPQKPFQLDQTSI